MALNTDIQIATACQMLHMEMQNYTECTYTGSDDDHAELYQQLKYIAYAVLPADADADDICNMWYEIQVEQATAPLSEEWAL